MTELKDVERQLYRFRQRALVAGVVVVLALGLLAVRMTVLQVVRHDDLLTQAESNRTAVLPTPPQRGRILDRHGTVLADNQSVYSLEIQPSAVPDMPQTLEALQALVALSPRDLRRFQRLQAESRRFDFLPLRSRLDDEEVARVASQLYRLPGVDIRARLLRHYPLGESASHVIGYIGRINAREQAQMEDWTDAEQANYRGTDHIGKLGIEQRYESLLHGQTGFERVETSATGRAIRTLDTVPAQPGQAVRLTIDARLQHLVETLFGERRGALVAIDPRNGEVLAFVSKPTYDPNLFVEGIDSESWKLLNESIDRPLLNRPCAAPTPPAPPTSPSWRWRPWRAVCDKPTP